MRFTKYVPQVGVRRCKSFFAWLPVSVRDRTAKHTRWLEGVTLVQEYVQGKGPAFWRNVRFVD